MARLALHVASALCLLLAVGAERSWAQSQASTPRLVPVLAGGSAGISSLPAPRSAASSATSDAIERLDAFARKQRLRSIARASRAASAADANARQRRSLRRLHERDPKLGPARVHLRPGTLTPRQIAGRVLEPAAGGGGSAAADAETARRLLRAQRDLLRLQDPDTELEIERVEGDALGQRHLRFSQSFAGIPVWPAQLIVHLDEEGDAILLDGASVPTPSGVRTLPRIDARAAASRAIQALGVGASATTETPELVVFAPGDRVPRLAWRFAVDAGLRFRRRVAIDAETGELLFSVSEIMDANVAGSGVDLFGLTRPLNVWNEGGVNYLVDTSKPMYDPTSNPPAPSTTRGAITVLDAQNQPPTSNPTYIPALYYMSSANPNAWGVAAGVSAAFNLSSTHDYYLTHHARSSIDGAGGSVLGVVRLGVNYPNAFWHSGLQAMFFGDDEPFAGAPDVVGHELTHGVIDSTASLLYLNQSGAANESLADIFGEMVETSVDGSPDWLLGADLSSPIRNMANPSALTLPCTQPQPYPSRMSQFLLATHPSCGGLVESDEGGVHLNSGILNHAYYLLAAALPAALGTTAAEQIFYRALTLHLTSSAQFIDVRLAAIESANELFGAGSPQAERTAQAFDEVEIFDGAGTGAPVVNPPQPGDDATLFVRYQTSPATYFLWRREAMLGDPNSGSPLSYYDASAQRSSVARNGAEAWFVDSLNDACVLDTDGDPLADPPDEEACLGLYGMVESLAVSANGQFLAAVLNESPFGQPTNELTVYDLDSYPAHETYLLEAPTRDGSPSSTLLFADAMSFTTSGGAIVFDALNEIALPGEVVQTWSIYLLDIATGNVLDVVAPLPGASFDYPALSRSSDEFITFDAVDVDTGISTIYAGSLFTGAVSAIDTVNGFEGVPYYTNGDTKIIYSEPEAGVSTGTSLYYRALAGDHLTPSGPRTIWLANADFGVIYGRGTFTAPAPDRDLDGIADSADNCLYERNPDQDDDGGLLSTSIDLIGNACECGDLGVDGRIESPDVAALRAWLARAPGAPPALQRCSVAGGIECDVRDASVLRRALETLGPGISPVCAAASEL